MNTIRKTTITLLMIFLTAAFATTSAAEGGQVAEAGVIQAEGTGEVWAFGRGKVVYRLEGEGTLTVRNVLANSVTSNGDGIRTVDGATVVYSEFKGTVTIEGPSISANSKGGAVVFVASGIGCVVFAGTGTYQKDGADPQEWQLTGTSRRHSTGPSGGW